MLQFEDLVFVGIDPHKHQHTAVMTDHWSKEFMQLEFSNTESGFQTLLDQVEDATPTGSTAVFGLEDTGGLGRPLAQWLVKKGYLVKGINPVRTMEARRKRPHPEKSDYRDAKNVARALLFDFDELPTVTEDATYQALREASRRRDQLVKDLTQCKNRFHKVIHDNYPEYKTFFSKPFGKTALAYWHQYPHPSALKNIGIQRLGAFLRKQARNMSTSQAEKILAHVEKDTPLTPDAKARNFVIRQLVEQIWFILDQITATESLIEELVIASDTHLQTMPGIAYVTAAKIIGRSGPVHRYSSSSAYARHAGCAPEDDDTGARGRKKKSKSGDRQLNAAIHQVALNQITVRNGQPASPAAFTYYQRKIAEGKTNLGALTCLKRRLCDIIFAMLRDQSQYLPPEPRGEDAEPESGAAA